MSELKERREQFVTGLIGGSISEINYVTAISVVGYFCTMLLASRDQTQETYLVVDFLINWIGMLLSITTYSDNPIVLNCMLVVPCFVYWSFTRKRVKVPGENALKDKFYLDKKPFITAYRGGMLIITALAILAVDFKIFPRRFAKVETWGTSLMDLGVGSFVFSGGLVSARTLLKDEMGGLRPGFSRKIVRSIRSSAAVLLLGLLRLYFVKSLDYQEHVTEYGVHWNFFMTLAFLPLALIPIDYIAAYVPRFILALMISGVYEYFMLYQDGFLEYLVAADRIGLINANREGIFSFLGYCAIFLWGQTTGFYTLGNIKTKNNMYNPSVSPFKPLKNSTRWDYLTSKSPLYGLAIWFTITLVFNGLIRELHPLGVSRRFGNLPYVMWVTTYNLGALMVYCSVDRLFKTNNSWPKESLSLKAMNQNGLIMFLLANILTGFINMNVPTIDLECHQALAILILYACILASLSMLMLKRHISIKL
ncbi:LAMI_0H07778g1_1 [Lachancea mirantina]|uniref:GPI-anchored wall transfer protein n=1 Tax=Lachancea mirantina TaxID=1230905 RepID=A0A1G4KFQ5_9SACH|nr:LAMI_0H07778g1_1 [Lachancea mirantina]